MTDITGFLHFVDREPLTISSGAITPTQTRVLLKSEGGTSDVLKNINGGANGDLVKIQRVNGHTITVKHNAGNIRLDGANDKVLANDRDTLTLLLDNANWNQQSFST